MNNLNLLAAISDERLRQDKLKKEGKFPFTCAEKRERIHTLMTNGGFTSVPLSVISAAKLAILSEEFGEVSRHVAESLIDNSRYQPRELMKELIQVAAVALAWCEAIESEDL
jgi:hypothetical protein